MNKYKLYRSIWKKTVEFQTPTSMFYGTKLAGESPLRISYVQLKVSKGPWVDQLK